MNQPSVSYFIMPGIFFTFCLGMMIFECLVYVGVRRCRFANLPD